MFDQHSRYNQKLTYSARRGSKPRSIQTLPGVIEHTVSSNDRLDRLAAHYYNDPRKWWLILDANPEIGFAGDLDMGKFNGTVIVIPAVPGGRR